MDAAIQAFFDATNAGDNDAFVAAFADDAVLIDWGREFRGHAEIARWNANENIGVQSHIGVTGSERTESGSVVVGVQVSGNGYNGGGSFEFDTAGGKITRMQIRG
jgi:ketosteroid isomerase-like protein